MIWFSYGISLFLDFCHHDLKKKRNKIATKKKIAKKKHNFFLKQLTSCDTRELMKHQHKEEENKWRKDDFSNSHQAAP